MATTIPPLITQRARSLLPGSIVELFILDASMLISGYTGQPGPIFAFHSYELYGTDQLVFQGLIYQPFPVMGEGWESNSQGKLPQPTLTVSNIAASAYSTGILSALLREFGDLVGARVTRKQTLLEFLDDQPTADPVQEFPPQVYFVDRKAQETKSVVQLVLASNLEVTGVQIPRGQLNANACPHVYRSGDGCDYAGQPRTDQYGNLLGPVFTDGHVTINLPGITSATAHFTNADVGLPLSDPGGVLPDRTFIQSVTNATTAVLTKKATATSAALHFTLNRLRSRGLWASGTANYLKWDYVFVTIRGVNVFYVALQNVPAGMYPLFNPTLWVGDVCIKALNGGCRIRFGDAAILPFGAFPALGRTPFD